MWSDALTRDPGFIRELVWQLRRADAIVLAVSDEGLGRYQERTELDRIVDAMNSNLSCRLVLALVGNAERPAGLERFDTFNSRTDEIVLAEDDASIAGLIRTCYSEYDPCAGQSPEDRLAIELADRFKRGKNLVIVVGPYAWAESDYGQATPARAIERFVAANHLDGAPPWIDVMGSIARSMFVDFEEGVDRIVSALRGDDSCDQSGLGVYLRLIAANWKKLDGYGKVFIVTSMPDEWIDLALGGSNLQVPHLKMIHNARDAVKLELRHLVETGGGELEDVELAPDDRLAQSAKIVLVKPFGSVTPDRAARKAMLTAEDWRSGLCEMPLPSWASAQMQDSALLLLGAGAFSPNVQMLFRMLLRTPLARAEDNNRRYLIHNPDVAIEDPLHKIEAALIRDIPGGSRETFSTWLKDNYGLFLKTLDPVKLLVSIEYFNR